MSTTWAFKRGEFLPVGIECRHLRRASRRPVQRMEAHHHIVLAQIVAEFYLYMLFALHRRQLEIRGRVSDLQRHDFLLFMLSNDGTRGRMPYSRKSVAGSCQN